MNGQLRDHPLVELIREISAARLSGALRLERERVRAAIYFASGEMVFARSNLRAQRLAESIRHWGVVPHEQLDAALSATMTDEEAGAALIAAGMIDHAGLKNLRARQSIDAVRPLLLWPDGKWRFDPHARLDETVDATPIDTSRLLLEGARRLPLEFVAARLADSNEMISPAGATTSNGLQILPTEAFVLSRVDASMRIGEALAVSGVPESEARQALYALALGGFLTREHWPRAFASAGEMAQAQMRSARREAMPALRGDAARKGSVDEKSSAAGSDNLSSSSTAPADSQSEQSSLFARAGGGDYYEVLDVSRGADSGEIKRAYYALAKRFHPDRFRHDADAGLRTRIEHAFAKIAQAYEVLKDAPGRAAYDTKLNATPNGFAPVTSGIISRVASNTNPSHASQQPSQFVSSAGPFVNSSAASPNDAEKSFQQGLAALQKGNQSLAVTCLADAARLIPAQPRYRAYYGRALSRETHTRRQAEAELTAAISLDARNAGYRVMLAELYRDIGHRLRAISELERAQAIDPHHADARRLLMSLKAEN